MTIRSLKVQLSSSSVDESVTDRFMKKLLVLLAIGMWHSLWCLIPDWTTHCSDNPLGHNVLEVAFSAEVPSVTKGSNWTANHLQVFLQTSLGTSLVPRHYGEEQTYQLTDDKCLKQGEYCVFKYLPCLFWDTGSMVLREMSWRCMLSHSHWPCEEHPSASSKTQRW